MGYISLSLSFSLFSNSSSHESVMYKTLNNISGNKPSSIVLVWLRLSFFTPSLIELSFKTFGICLRLFCQSNKFLFVSVRRKSYFPRNLYYQNNRFIVGLCCNIRWLSWPHLHRLLQSTIMCERVQIYLWGFVCL